MHHPKSFTNQSSKFITEGPHYFCKKCDFGGYENQFQKKTKKQHFLGFTLNSNIINKSLFMSEGEDVKKQKYVVLYLMRLLLKHILSIFESITSERF